MYEAEIVKMKAVAQVRVSGCEGCPDAYDREKDCPLIPIRLSATTHVFSPQ
jgi:hypothetical protein